MASSQISKATRWNMFVNELLWEIDTTAQLDLSSNSILLTRFGKGPDQQEENSVVTCLRSKNGLHMWLCYMRLKTYYTRFLLQSFTSSLLTTYHNIPTDNISSQQWVEVNVKQCQTLTDILRFCHKARRNGKTHLEEKEETKENPRRKRNTKIKPRNGTPKTEGRKRTDRRKESFDRKNFRGSQIMCTCQRRKQNIAC